MAKKVIMPKFGMDQEEGTVSAWLKQEGDSVEKGEPILEVETDKVNMEVEAPADGILAGIKVGPGVTVPIGEVIAYILRPGEALPPSPETSPEGRKSYVSSPVGGIEGGLPAKAEAPPPKATPVAERVAQSHGLNLHTVSPPRAGERLTKADVQGYLAAQVTASPQPSPEGRKSYASPPLGGIEGGLAAVPAARRLARELGVDLAELTGSGPNGRIQSRDVQQAAARPPVEAQPVAMPGHLTARRQVPLTGMRRTIAERLTASVREVPQFTVSVEVNMARAQATVDDLRATSVAAEGPKVTLTTFLVKACAWALGRHPAVNASLKEGVIYEWAEINVGVAVAVEAGLIVPVLRGADGLTLPALAAQMSDLGQRARAGQLRSEDVQNGTFTISNLGMFGVDHFTAILNPPQAAILAVGRVIKRPVVLADDRIEVQPMADFTLTADHRIVDGAVAGRFLADLKQAVERPGLLL